MNAVVNPITAVITDSPNSQNIQLNSSKSSCFENATQIPDNINPLKIIVQDA